MSRPCSCCGELGHRRPTCGLGSRCAADRKKHLRKFWVQYPSEESEDSDPPDGLISVVYLDRARPDQRDFERLIKLVCSDLGWSDCCLFLKDGTPVLTAPHLSALCRLPPIPFLH